MNALMYMFENGKGEVFREKGEWLYQGRDTLFGFIWHINLRDLKLQNGRKICCRSHGDNIGLKRLITKNLRCWLILNCIFFSACHSLASV